MEERNLKVTINKAKEWYNSGNKELRELALQTFDEDELRYESNSITSFKDACEFLSLNYNDIESKVKSIAEISKSSAAMFQLNIVRRALNFGYDLHLTKDPKNSHIYFPVNSFITESSTYYKDELDTGELEVIGIIENEGISYKVLGGAASYSSFGGLSNFSSYDGVGYAAYEGYYACATKEIAQQFSKHFGMLILESKYCDMVNIKVIEDKFGNSII